MSETLFPPLYQTLELEPGPTSLDLLQLLPPEPEPDPGGLAYGIWDESAWDGAKWS